MSLLYCRLFICVLLYSSAVLGMNYKEKLRKAVLRGQVNKVKDLLAHVDSNASLDNNGLTALHIAVFNANMSVIETLLQAGADTQVVDKKGFTPLCCASDKGYIDVVKLLLQAGSSPDGNYKEGFFTPLHFAARRGYSSIIKILLEAGAQKDILWTSVGVTPLQLAVELGHNDIVKLLISAGANKDRVNAFHGYSLLHEAVNSGNTALVKILLEAGANPNSLAGDNKTTPLHFAAIVGSVRSAKLLLDYDASIDMQNNIAGSPLFFALQRNHINFIEMLLDREMAMPNNMPGEVVVAIKKAQDNREDIMDAVDSEDCLCIRQLLREGVYPTESALLLLYTNYKLLLESVKNGDIEVVQELNNQGLSLTIKYTNGDTLLHRAVSANQPDMVRYLLDIRMDPTIENDYQQTPVHLASDKENILNIMLEYAYSNWPDVPVSRASYNYCTII
jgi:ankyrin repeat protein